MLHVDLQELFTTQHSVTSQNLVSSLIYIPTASDSHFSILVCMYGWMCVCVYMYILLKIRTKNLIVYSTQLQLRFD